jgi:hypothetical protein
MKRYFLSVCAPRAVATVVFALLTAIGCSAALAQQMNTPHPADPGQLWLSMEYLTWSVSGDKLPALVTTSPAGTPQASAGVLGAAGTSVLFGNSTVDGDWRSGGRVSGGYWFDRGHTSGVEVSVFGLEQASTGFNANSGSFPILARPFTDATTGLQNANLIAFPGLLSGSVTASETSNLLGADAVYRRDIGDFGREHLSALFGYRFLYASDHLDISSASTVIGGQVLPLGTVITPNDDFKTQNYFSGIDFGIAGDSATGPWSLEWRADVALGVNVDREQINGSTTVLTGGGGGTATYQGGLLALSSNIGSYVQTRFAAVPDFSLKAGYQFAPGWRVIAGYDVLYWTGVQRAGNTIDTTVNPNLTPPPAGGGPARPQAQFNTSALVAQGFSTGLKYAF